MLKKFLKGSMWWEMMKIIEEYRKE